MVLANKMCAFLVEQWRVREVESKRKMAAAIFVGDELALKSREKSLGRLALVHEGKFQRSSFGNVIRARNFNFRHLQNFMDKRSAGNL